MSADGRDKQFGSVPASGSATDAYRRFLDRTVSDGEAEIRELKRLRAQVLAGSVSVVDANRALLADEAKERTRAIRWANLKRRVQRARVRRVAPMRGVAARRERRSAARRRTRTSIVLRAKGPPGPPEPPEPAPDARRARWLKIARRGGRRG
jgi:hypothetical protein